MNVNIEDINPSVISIINDPTQIITLDANIIIPPYRIPLGKSLDITKYMDSFLDPLFMLFPQLAIHEAVKDEIVGSKANEFLDNMINSIPCKLIILKDSTLSDHERWLQNTIEGKFIIYTKYSPVLKNKEDYGEIKTLSHMAVKDLIYFASNDNEAIKLVEKAEKLKTGLDNLKIVKIYELIYCLHRAGLSENKFLKMLYKYLYYLTDSETNSNHSWNDFIQGMEALYSNC